METDSRSGTTNYGLTLYKNVNFSVGDNVQIVFHPFNLNVNTRIIAMSFNPYNRREISIEVGDYRPSISDNLYQMEQIRREHPDLVLYNGYDEIFASGLLAGADGGIGSTYNIMGWRYQGIVKALKEGDIQTAQKLQTECNKVIDLLIKTGVFRGLKTVLHYMDVVSVPLCRKPFGPVDEKYLPELKALAQQLMQERG